MITRDELRLLAPFHDISPDVIRELAACARERRFALGEVPLFAGGTHPATAIAMEPTRCALFSRAALEAAIGGNPAVAFALLNRLALRVRELVTRLDERSSLNVHDRLMEFIRARPRSPRTTAISLGMTQQALAEELGTVREVVARELRALCRTGTLRSLGGGRYVLCEGAAFPRSVR